MDEMLAFDQESFREDQITFTSETERLLASKPVIVLYTISSARDTEWKEKGLKEGQTVIRGFPILGRVELKNSEDRKEISGALLKGLREARTDILIPTCFLPHHALTISKGEKKVDLIICFKCTGVEAHGAYTGAKFSISEKVASQFDAMANKYALKSAP